MMFPCYRFIMDKLVNWILSGVLISLLLTYDSFAQSGEIVGWPVEITEIRYLSSSDSTLQPALFYDSGKQEARPLLVALHTWSGDYRQITSIPYAEWCIENDWIMIHPDFRGVCDHPQATGSPLAVQDVIDAVDWVCQTVRVDSARIYMVGSSWGGTMALLVASRAPEIWAAVSVWAPVIDLKKWYFESVARQNHYPPMIAASCGGPPDISEESERQYRQRSALHYLEKARSVPIDINAGIEDGHTGPVPVDHAIRAYNRLADSTRQIPGHLMASITGEALIPFEYQGEIRDLNYGTKIPLFRKSSANVRLTIFQGSHEIIPRAALKWLTNWSKF